MILSPNAALLKSQKLLSQNPRAATPAMAGLHNNAAAMALCPREYDRGGQGFQASLHPALSAPRRCYWPESTMAMVLHAPEDGTKIANPSRLLSAATENQGAAEVLLQAAEPE